ncbi:MAG: PAS domain S-box protein [Rhodothermaceae bacterium]
MPNELKILFIEDNTDDVLLISRKLKKEGFSFTHIVVNSIEELRSAFENHRLDLIISDYSLPEFNGLDALRIYKEFNLDIPFILVSGTIGEELAVKAMKEGIHDYLMKDRLERLAPAVEREIREYRIREKNRNAEVALRESERRYRELVEMSPDGILILHNEHIIFTNKSAIKILNFKTVYHSFNEDIKDYIVDKDCLSTFLSALKSREKTDHIECQIRQFDGGILDCEISIVPIIHNGIEAQQLIIRDITKRKTSEKTIRQLSRAVIQSPVAIIITDPKGLIEYINPKFEEKSGFTFDEINGQKLRVLKEGILPDDKHRELWKTISSGNEWKGEVINKTKTGVKYWENVVISPIIEDFKIQHYVIVKEDITERKLMETEIIEAKEKAENSEKLKSEFLAQMSHEIRSPINVVLSFSNLIRSELEGKLSEELSESFLTLDNAGRRIIRTIDLILNMSEIQTDSYDYIPRNINLNKDIIAQLYDEYKHLASEKGLDLFVNYKTGNSELVADEYSLTQVFANLIDNAITYTEKGKVDINVERNNNGHLQVEICDTGIGISEQYIPNLFKPFTQEEQGYTRKYEGNGLGLALVQNYCELNNADIIVESQKDKGSKFTVAFKPN